MSVLYRNNNGDETAITGSSDIVNVIQSGNMNPITSNAVYQLKNLMGGGNCYHRTLS